MDTTTSVEATISSVASKGMSGGTVTSVYGWITSNEAMALIGVIVAVLGFIVNCIFQFRRDMREQELHRSKLAALKDADKS